MGEKRLPLENEVPKHKKKSKKKGQPRADHKHEYKAVVLHSWWDNPFKHGVINEHMEVCEVCTVCGRIGTYVTGRFFGLDNYDIAGMEHWMVDDYFDKFAKKMNKEN
jgi:hypothetical protein